MFSSVSLLLQSQNFLFNKQVFSTLCVRLSPTGCWTERIECLFFLHALRRKIFNAPVVLHVHIVRVCSPPISPHPGRAYLTPLPPAETPPLPGGICWVWYTPPLHPSTHAPIQAPWTILGLLCTFCLVGQWRDLCSVVKCKSSVGGARWTLPPETFFVSKAN